MRHNPRHRPKRLVALFLAVTAVPTCGLVWLSLHILDQDRVLARQQLRDRLEGVVATVAADIRRDLNSLDLARAVAFEERDAVHATLSADGVIDRRSASLPFVPSAPVAAEPDPAVWRDGEAAEIAARHDVAAATYRKLARSTDPLVRAGALVRLARVERHASRRRPDAALAIYARLAELGDVPVFGEPAALVAREAQLRTLSESGRNAEHRKEAASLRADLAKGRWAIDWPTFEAAWIQSGGDPPDVRDEAFPRIALAMAIETTWREWRDEQGSTIDAHGERTLWIRDRPVTLVWRARGGRLDVLAADSAFFLRRWRAFWEPRGVTVGLFADGRLVLGDAAPEPVSRAPQDTGLPWTIRVSSRAPVEELAALAGRRQSLILVLVIASFLVLAGAYFVARGVRREVEVARLQSDFVSAVSHEFRTPLTSMSHLVELLRDRPLDEDRRRRYYDALDQETARLRRFVDGLLEFGRVDAGRAQYALTSVVPAALVSAIVDRFRRDPAAGEHPVRIAVEPDMPTVTVDASAIELALRNLLENAAKYSPNSTPIDVGVVRDGATIVVRVSDEGPGIPLQEQSLIFDKFVRGAGARQSSVGGTGIGLALAREIARAHHGDVTVASEPGRGSTFTLWLPILARSGPAT